MTLTDCLTGIEECRKIMAENPEVRLILLDHQIEMIVLRESAQWDWKWRTVIWKYESALIPF